MNQSAEGRVRSADPNALADLEHADAAEVVLAAFRIGQSLPPQLLDKVYTLEEVVVQLRAVVRRIVITFQSDSAHCRKYSPHLFTFLLISKHFLDFFLQNGVFLLGFDPSCSDWAPGVRN